MYILEFSLQFLLQFRPPNKLRIQLIFLVNLKKINNSRHEKPHQCQLTTMNIFSASFLFIHNSDNTVINTSIGTDMPGQTL